MASAHVCDVCGDTISEIQPRTILSVETAVGKNVADVDAPWQIDCCEKCRASNPEALVQAITRVVTVIRSKAGAVHTGGRPRG